MSNSGKGNEKNSSVFFALFIAFVIQALIIASFLNCYYTEKGLLRELKEHFPEIEKVVEIKKHYFSKTLIRAQTKSNLVMMYELDSSIMFDYTFESIKE